MVHGAGEKERYGIRVWFSMGMMQGTVMACLSPHGSCPTATRDVCPVLKPNICKQSSSSLVLSGGEREFLFPTISGNTGQFRFLKIWKEFFIPFPKSWECNFTTFIQLKSHYFQVSVYTSASAFQRWPVSSHRLFTFYNLNLN